MTDKNKILFITRDTQHRLIADIKEIMQSPLTDQGIYYAHDEEDMLKGYSMFIGPSETIYADGNFFFSWKFPYNYPYSPPELKFLTSDGVTRFHPNLYRNGKVCLSLLNTWKGEQWTSCQTIRSILLTILTLFHNEPLLNEPGFSKTHKDFIPYNTTIEYQNYKCAIIGMASQRMLPSVFVPFFSFIKSHFLQEYENIKKRIEEKAAKETDDKPKKLIWVSVYNLKTCIDYTSLLSTLEKTYKILNT
jgi:ubiquitin-conjugating enzyme E2 Z